MTEHTPAEPGATPRPTSELERWVAEVAAALALDPAVATALTAPVLDRVRDVAHGVLRPAAPMTAFLVGLAAGTAAAGAGPSVAHASEPGADAELVDEVLRRLVVVDGLVAGWTDAGAQHGGR